MQTRNDGGPAFPWGEHGTHLGGMTLRDYFAAKSPISFEDAMVAADIESEVELRVAVNRSLFFVEKRARVMRMLAQLRYEYADAMLAAREVQP